MVAVGVRTYCGVLGCGLLALTLTGACTTIREPALPMVRSEAAKDLACPPKSLQIVEQVGGIYRVTGCGRTALYHTACDGLQCRVGRADEAAPGWRDRPEPGSIEEGR